MVYTGMFTAALFVMGERLKQSECLWTGEWTNNLECTYKMGYPAELTCQQGKTLQIQGQKKKKVVEKYMPDETIFKV